MPYMDATDIMSPEVIRTTTTKTIDSKGPCWLAVKCISYLCNISIYIYIYIYTYIHIHELHDFCMTFCVSFCHPKDSSEL